MINTQIANSTFDVPVKARILLSLLKKMKVGTLELVEPSGRKHVYKGDVEGPEAQLIIKNWQAIQLILTKGDIGLAESYRDGLIDFGDISSFIHWACLNEDVLTEQFHGSWVGTLVYKVKHMLNRNTEKGSKKNISAHYDLGNDFYRLWLDSTMTYSSALFKNVNETLQAAQINKYEAILDRLNLKENDTILEIGCGWGGFITQAVKRSVKVVALTISEEQFAYVENLIEKNGWQSKVQLLKQDYRLHEGQYDHVVSIEMIEAVGFEYWPTYFQKIKSALKPSGSAIIQGISIRDDLFEDYKAGTDFIQQYIFPGGMLLGPKAAAKVWESEGLVLKEAHFFGHSYARTLRLWAEKFNQELPQVYQLGFDEKFTKIWNFYLGYCEGAFWAGRVDVAHYELRVK